jgi:hypothetical protein
MRHLLALYDLSAVEYSLWEGQAYDALSSLRQVIQEYNYNLLDKKNNVHGVAAGLRSESFLRILNKDKKATVNKYRRARHALLGLGLPKTDMRWRELRDDELWGKNVSVTRSIGDSRKRDPWFWHVVQPAGLSQEQQKEWSVDSASQFTFAKAFLTYIIVVDRVKWFRDRADRDRFREEVEILEAEFERTMVSFNRMSDVWTELASRATGPGSAAYAQRKAVMYRGLAEECKQVYSMARKRAGCSPLE